MGYGSIVMIAKIVKPTSLIYHFCEIIPRTNHFLFLDVDQYERRYGISPILLNECASELVQTLNRVQPVLKVVPNPQTTG